MGWPWVVATWVPWLALAAWLWSRWAVAERRLVRRTVEAGLWRKLVGDVERSLAEALGRCGDGSGLGAAGGTSSRR